MAYPVKITNMAIIQLLKRIYPKISKIILLEFLVIGTAFSVLAADENIGLTVYYDGKEIPIAVSTTDVTSLRTYKNGTVYYIQLVDVADPLATKMRIDVPGVGIKAIKKFESFVVFDDLCETNGWCPVEGWVWTKTLECAFASVNGGPKILLGCNRSNQALMFNKVPISVFNFKPKPFVNQVVIYSNCAGGGVCPAAPAVPGYPGSATEAYLDDPNWTGNIVASTDGISSNGNVQCFSKLGTGRYKIGVNDDGGTWENLYATIDFGTTYDINISCGAGGCP